MQPAPERAQASSHGAEDMEDVVELGVTRAEGRVHLGYWFNHSVLDPGWSFPSVEDWSGATSCSSQGQRLVDIPGGRC